MAFWNNGQQQADAKSTGTGKPDLVTPIVPREGAASPPQPEPEAQAPASRDAKTGGVTDDAKRKAAATSIKLSATVGDIAVLMSRAPGRKHFSLADIEWMIVPPVLARQVFVVEAQHKDTGFRAPAAVITWAKVSDEVDKRLTENAGTQPLRLRPDEWTSGENYWLIDAVGDGRALAPALRQLADTTFKDSVAKLVAQGAQGKAIVETLSDLLKRNETKIPAAAESAKE